MPTATRPSRTISTDHTGAARRRPSPSSAKTSTPTAVTMASRPTWTPGPANCHRCTSRDTSSHASAMATASLATRTPSSARRRVRPGTARAQRRRKVVVHVAHVPGRADPLLASRRHRGTRQLNFLLIRQSPTANRQSPTAKRQSPTAKRQSPTAKRQSPTAKSPTANRNSNRNSPTANCISGPEPLRGSASTNYAGHTSQYKSPLARLQGSCTEDTAPMASTPVSEYNVSVQREDEHPTLSERSPILVPFSRRLNPYNFLAPFRLIPRSWDFCRSRGAIVPPKE